MISLIRSINSNEDYKKRLILFLKIFIALISGIITILWIILDKAELPNQIFKMIVGVWHSHADLNFNRPSKTDEDMKEDLYCSSHNLDIPLTILNPSVAKSSNNLKNSS